MVAIHHSSASAKIWPETGRFNLFGVKMIELNQKSLYGMTTRVEL